MNVGDIVIFGFIKYRVRNVYKMQGIDVVDLDTLKRTVIPINMTAIPVFQVRIKPWWMPQWGIW